MLSLQEEQLVSSSSSSAVIAIRPDSPALLMPEQPERVGVVIIAGGVVNIYMKVWLLQL